MRMDVEDIIAEARSLDREWQRTVAAARGHIHRLYDGVVFTVAERREYLAALDRAMDMLGPRPSEG